MKEIEEHITINNIAIIGNPNCGKTTLFNALTGLRQKVGNYPGVTVEKKVGKIVLKSGKEISILDLPGTYSLSANSPDEKVATDVLLGKISETLFPDAVICVIDASNLERNLYLLSQVIDQHFPVIVSLNMIDVAEQEGTIIDVKRLERSLGVKIIPTVASKGIGIDNLLSTLEETVITSPFAKRWTLPDKVRMEHEELVSLLVENDNLHEHIAFHEAQMLLSTPHDLNSFEGQYSNSTLSHLKKDHEVLESLGIDRHAVFVESRYRWIKSVCENCVTYSKKNTQLSFSDKIDFFATHRIWGFVIFFGLMALMFQTIFSVATVPMELISEGFRWLGMQAGHIIPPGDLHDLLVDGVISGVGAVVTFLPQILFLFLFLGLLEDTGYMARAAFIMDRLMGKVGLHGKSFIPLLSSFACAIPGIMATRTIENPKDRLVTMLVAPLMSCSARLPVYALLIASFIPNIAVLGFIGLPGIVLVSMYLLGLITALIMAWIFKNTLLKGKKSAFIMELPPYRIPSIKNTLFHMWERSRLFLKKAGTIILGVSIILWFLATYPKLGHGTSSEKLAHSFVGQAGHLVEPVLKPLGFDWKIGIGIISSLLQREVFVSTMGTIYNMDNGSNNTLSLREQMQKEIDPNTGLPKFTVLTAICIMVYYVLAMQCMSTIAIMKRETNGWKWPAFQFAYMTALAYAGAFLTYRIGLWIIS
ncbi:MAG: ferrous iron transport protein B [Bacteroidota bacterium]|nr:ferrous iron transport protein B [Bacteroidota bacterium]